MNPVRAVGLSLTQLVLRIGLANHAHNTLAHDDLALFTPLLH